jgi:hypothetical protein
MSRREDYIKGEQKPSVQILVRNSDGSLQINKIAATSLVDLETLPDQIRKALNKDLFAKTVRESPEEHEEFEWKDGILQFEGRTYVLTIMRDQVLQAFHDGPIRGHPGIIKMVQLVQIRFWFPRMRLAIEEYVRKCTICRQMKHNRHLLYGKL